ncbi:GIY-YIG nuclease family protein [Cytobacillus spongiae]|uniref:GIY-YIG nuclease family protein n=1 Tax=Cytobacillus spongiae TaxID=2901381 RepID=UPI001F28ABF8|nr:GIY-YIG nuclease family protein [Cytobacillus spongiae]UII55678.1 GIY-YIG nuclease family protein [Cytobacillus spongiae]
MLTLSEILTLRGLDCSEKIKLVRHKDKRFDIDKLYKLGQLNYYQKHQETPVFHDCSYVISFIGLPSNQARLLGVYKVLGYKATKEWDIPDTFIYRNSFKDSNYIYDLEEVDLFKDLKERVVINWGKGAINWAQWLKDEPGKDKEIIEILPKGYVKHFPGFDELIITFNELKDIMDNPIANKEWHLMLSSVSGIYLIVDQRTGQQYVGSASGKEGILGRWKNYSETGHGGNKELINLIVNDSYALNNLCFTILKTLPLSMTSTEVVFIEQRYKEKLGTRNFGLNLN